MTFAGVALGGQIRARLRDFYIGATLVQLKPTALDRELEPRRIFRKRRFVAKQEGVVDLLNIDPAVLNRLESSGVFQEAPRGRLRVGVGTVSSVFHRPFS